MVERSVVVLEDRHADARAVARTDDRLVGRLRESAGGVEPVDAGPSALVDVDERLPAVDDADAVDPLEVADLVFRRRHHVPAVDPVAGPGFDGEPFLCQRHVLDRSLEPFPARGLDVFGEQIEQPSGVDAGGETGEVLEVCVPPEDRAAGVDHERVESVAGGEDRRRATGDAPADHDDVTGGVGGPVHGRRLS